MGREVRGHVMGVVAASVKQVALPEHRRRANLDCGSMDFKCQSYRLINGGLAKWAF